MKSSTISRFSFLVIAPYVVGFTPPDSSYDEYSVGAGGGQFATYDCSSNASPNSFKDGGVKFTHKFASPFRAGVSVSTLPGRNRTNVIPYPDLALDFRYFSLGTTGVRLGDRDDFYAEVAGFDQVPFGSGMGCARAGTGFKIFGDTHLFLGVNTIPYYAGGFAGQIDFPISRNQFIFINARNGNTGGVTEYGISAGLRTRLE